MPEWAWTLIFLFSYAKHVAPYPAYWLRWGLGNPTPLLAWNQDPPNLYLLNS
jgi:hypothetical protein